LPEVLGGRWPRGGGGGGCAESGARKRALLGLEAMKGDAPDAGVGMGVSYWSSSTSDIEPARASSSAAPTTVLAGSGADI
jgi:hypothetical protein